MKMRFVAGLSLVLSLACTPMVAASQTTPPAGSAPMSTADAPERLALSNRFIAAMQTDQMAGMMSQITTALTPRRPGMTDEQSASLNRAMARATSQMMPRMFEAMAPIYAETFSVEELRALVAFYESDLGQSMVRKTYEATPRMTAAMMQIMPEMIYDMVDTMCDEMGCTAEERVQIEAAMAQSGYARPAS